MKNNHLQHSFTHFNALTDDSQKLFDEVTNKDKNAKVSFQIEDYPHLLFIIYTLPHQYVAKLVVKWSGGEVGINGLIYRSR